MAERPRQKTLPRPGMKQADAPEEEPGPSGAGLQAKPRDAASEAEIVVEDAPSEPEHNYNAPENQPAGAAAKALGSLEA